MIGSEETLETLNRILFGLVRSNSIEKTITILGLGLDINTQDDHGQTPIFLAALYNHLSMVEKLAELGADLETKDKLGDTILSKIVSKNNPYKKVSKEEQLAMVKLLIKQGAKLTTRSHNALPIHRAIQARCSLDIIKALLTEDTVNQKDYAGLAPLHLAVLKGRRDIVKLLIEYKYVDINIREDTNEDTPLIMAARDKWQDVVMLLLAHKADLNLKNKYGEWFFDFASQDVLSFLFTNVSMLMESRNELDEHLPNHDPYNNHLQVKYQVLKGESRTAPLIPILSDLGPTYDKQLYHDLSVPSTSKMLQPSILDLDSLRSSLSGSFTNQFQEALNIDSSSRSTISEISQYEDISSPGSSISAASRRRNISPPRSITSESTRSSIDSFSPSGSYAVDSKRRRF
ncbi:ankyrin repeat domain-containing protein [Candidatus Mesenet endosymbiont of Phosphuga atrata]|uniref:ankyrin repeat domain-containing protein n=1 Tax=Candidatus Mesenet endosymbiont of Phosphuga atrata TaxID=3066221 RepID=UPI0030D14B9D